MSRKKSSQVSNIQNIKSMSIYLSSTGLQTIRKKLYMFQHPTKCGVEILPTSVLQEALEKYPKPQNIQLCNYQRFKRRS